VTYNANGNRPGAVGKANNDRQLGHIKKKGVATAKTMSQPKAASERVYKNRGRLGVDVCPRGESASRTVRQSAAKYGSNQGGTCSKGERQQAREPC